MQELGKLKEAQSLIRYASFHTGIRNGCLLTAYWENSYTTLTKKLQTANHSHQEQAAVKEQKKNMRSNNELNASSMYLKYSGSGSVGLFWFKHAQSSRCTFSISLSNDTNRALKNFLEENWEDSFHFTTKVWDVTTLKKLNVLRQDFIAYGFVVLGLGCKCI